MLCFFPFRQCHQLKEQRSKAGKKKNKKKEKKKELIQNGTKTYSKNQQKTDLLQIIKDAVQRYIFEQHPHRPSCRGLNLTSFASTHCRTYVIVVCLRQAYTYYSKRSQSIPFLSLLLSLPLRHFLFLFRVLRVLFISYIKSQSL